MCAAMLNLIFVVMFTLNMNKNDLLWRHSGDLQDVGTLVVNSNRNLLNSEDGKRLFADFISDVIAQKAPPAISYTSFAIQAMHLIFGKYPFPSTICSIAVILILFFLLNIFEQWIIWKYTYFYVFFFKTIILEYILT